MTIKNTFSPPTTSTVEQNTTTGLPENRTKIFFFKDRLPCSNIKLTAAVQWQKRHFPWTPFIKVEFKHLLSGCRSMHFKTNSSKSLPELPLSYFRGLDYFLDLVIHFQSKLAWTPRPGHIDSLEMTKPDIWGLKRANILQKVERQRFNN